jgi:hypothetical protein
LGHGWFLRLLFVVIASVATCPPKLNERRRKQSILAKDKCFAEPVIGRACARPVGSQ